MFSRKVAGMLMVLAVSIVSCTKDTVDEPAPPTEKKLVVNLGPGGLPIDRIDSASVVLRRQGTTTPYFFRLQKGTNRLEATIDGLRAGEWTADFEIYTKAQLNKSMQIVSVRQITIGNAETITIAGPVDPPSNGWSARKVIAADDNDIVVIIPFDVNDPYFEIRTKGFQWDFFGVQRTALYGNAVVAFEEWTCDNGCPGNDRLIFNKTKFLPFTQAIQNSLWNKNEIVITVGNLQNQVYNEFGHEWHN